MLRPGDEGYVDLTRVPDISCNPEHAPAVTAVRCAPAMDLGNAVSRVLDFSSLLANIIVSARACKTHTRRDI